MEHSRGLYLSVGRCILYLPRSTEPRICREKKKTTRAVLLQSTEYFKRSPNNESFVNKDHLLKTKTTWIEQTTSQSITCAELHCQTHVYIYPV